MAVSDREFEALAYRVGKLEDRVAAMENTAAETRGAAREAAKIASRLVAIVAIAGSLAQVIVGLYFHVRHGAPAPSGVVR